MSVVQNPTLSLKGDAAAANLVIDQQPTDDRMIPFPAQQFMCQRAGATSVEVGGSHAIYVSNPGAVADLIKSAAKSAR